MALYSIFLVIVVLKIGIMGIECSRSIRKHSRMALIIVPDRIIATFRSVRVVVEKIRGYWPKLRIRFDIDALILKNNSALPFCELRIQVLWVMDDLS